jgi:tetratricopeptide (TPR) repeat protein
MRVRHTALLGIGLALNLSVLLGFAGASVAAAGDPPAEAFEPRSQLGSYLAGRLAGKGLDLPAAAAFYAKALQQDPDNATLLDLALQTEVSEGSWTRAEVLSRQLVATDPSNRIAQTLLGISAFKAGRYAEAEAHFNANGLPPIGELTNSLARAWIMQAQGRTDDALATIDSARLPDAASTFLRYHRALLADVAGRTAEARTSYSRIWKNDQRVLRIALAYARHAVSAGDAKLAQSVLNAHFERIKGAGHPHARALREQIEAGERSSLLITSPAEGMGELFYWLGEQFVSEPVQPGTEPVTLRLGMVFLQFSLYLAPNQSFPLLALADAQEMAKRYAAANEAYGGIPKGSPLEVIIEIRKAVNLNRLERAAEAQSLLEGLARQHPRDVRPLEALGNLLRDQKRHAEAVDYYDKAIALIGKPEAAHWKFFYARGTSYERMKKLALAETDLQRAL